jgi:RIP metalloprotease RseP
MTDVLDAPESATPARPNAVDEADELGIQPARFLGLLGVVAAMAILGGWELLVIVGILVACIVIHEAGHYFTARWSGMKATEFFIGFGPRIFAWQHGETTYGLKALPLGAYVRIIGMNNLDEVDPSDEPRAYRNAPWHKRFLTVAAGPATHFVIAILLAGVAIWQFGQEVEGEWQVGEVIPLSAADTAGIEGGDQLVRIDGQSVADFDALAIVVPNVQGELVEIDLLRDDEPLTIEARIGERLTAAGSAGYSGLYEGDVLVGFDGVDVENYADFASQASTRIGETVDVEVVYGRRVHSERVTINEVNTDTDAVSGFLGISNGAVRERLPLSDAASEAIPTVWGGTKQLGSRFGTLFSSVDGWRGLFALPPIDAEGGTVVDSVAIADQQRPQAELDENRLLSIVGAVDIGKQLVDEGVATVLIFFVGLNISLGMINLVPLLPFDGGHMAVATYERLRSFGGRVHRVDAARLLPLTYAVLAFMMLVGGIAIVRDLVDPIQL